ncbi:hypothetical protein [Nannocystis pusilla]|uniref:Tetratricopeptide repeat protein n=1 Tax=Nannocystis pusilla TaxID=889268 RepID=A0ABS7TJW2_9BACT|nr:hypothetical protein [Nannocystis pusilla]MBZ5708522.1 hypothetical protein [Nannocystis pusilla]
MHLEDPLDGFLGDAREAVRAEADRGGRRRDFAAMIARAHAIDSQGVSREAVAEAARFAPVVALPRPRLAPAPAREEDSSPAPTAPRRRLGWLMAAAAGLLLAGAFAGAATQARRDGAATANAAPLVAPQPDRPSTTATPPGAGAHRHVSRNVFLKTGDETSPPEYEDGDASEDMFLKTEDERTAPPARGERGHASEDMPVRTCDEDPAPHPAAEHSHDSQNMPVRTCDQRSAPLAADDHVHASKGMPSETGHGSASRRDGARGEATPERQVAADRADEPPRRRGVSSRRRAEQPPAEAATDEAAWVALDRAAREAWRRGDTEEARALLSALVRTDAAASTVELAYGDLFVLTRKAGDQQALARLWQRYLARFPRGLYAEDARVGLCRRATGVEASACWDLYLGTWPEGAHADEARAARGGEGP